MKANLAVLAVAVLVASASAASAWERITSEDEYRARVVGKTHVNEAGSRWVHHPDGRITGTWAGKPMVGRWQWHQGFWCRNVRVGNAAETGTDCQMIEIRGNQVRNTRNQGRGDSGIARLE